MNKMRYGKGRREKVLGPVEVTVHDDVEKAIKVFKRKAAKEGLFKEMKKRRCYLPLQRKKE